MKYNCYEKKEGFYKLNFFLWIFLLVRKKYFHLNNKIAKKEEKR